MYMYAYVCVYMCKYLTERVQKQAVIDPKLYFRVVLEKT